MQQKWSACSPSLSSRHWSSHIDQTPFQMSRVKVGTVVRFPGSCADFQVTRTAIQTLSFITRGEAHLKKLQVCIKGRYQKHFSQSSYSVRVAATDTASLIALQTTTPLIHYLRRLRHTFFVGRSPAPFCTSLCMRHDVRSSSWDAPHSWEMLDVENAVAGTFESAKNT